jgi:hypothetical protein
MQAAKPEQGAGKLEQRQEVGRPFVVPDEQRPAFGEPGKRAFDDPATCGKALLSGDRIEFLFANTAQMRDVGMTGHGHSASGVVVAQIQTQMLRPLACGQRTVDDDGIQRRRQQHHIQYQHVIWSLVRKPGAFAAYRYHDDLFPTLVFRRAYDTLTERRPERADREYVRVLHLAATMSEAEVETALTLLLDAGTAPTFDAVRELVREPQPLRMPDLSVPVLDLGIYDQLLPSQATAAAPVAVTAVTEVSQ